MSAASLQPVTDIQPLLTLRDVAIGYGGSPFLNGIDLTLRAGEFLGLVGPNGAGKSTLLQAVIGIIKPLGGAIERREDLRLGYVPQRSRVDPIFPFSALEVVRAGGMGPKPRSQGGPNYRAASAERALNALGQVGIAKLAARPLRDLSGGQQQRVLIARALVREPDLLILDEPTAGMDIPSERDLLDFITELYREREVTIILVVHQLSLVAGRCSHLAIINKDLPLFAVGTATELLTSERLTELYGHPMEVCGDGEDMIVRAARHGEGACP